jgi:hypothetical protein
LGVEELAGGIGMAAARGRWRKMMVRVGRKANRPAEPEWCRFRQAKAQGGGKEGVGQEGEKGVGGLK